jgi:hypothetical protein
MTGRGPVGPADWAVTLSGASPWGRSDAWVCSRSAPSTGDGDDREGGSPRVGTISAPLCRLAGSSVPAPAGEADSIRRDGLRCDEEASGSSAGWPAAATSNGCAAGGGASVTCGLPSEGPSRGAVEESDVNGSRVRPTPWPLSASASRPSMTRGVDPRSDSRPSLPGPRASNALAGRGRTPSAGCTERAASRARYPLLLTSAPPTGRGVGGTG